MKDYAIEDFCKVIQYVSYKFLKDLHYLVITRMEKGILINSLPDIASHRLAFWQLAFLQIELYYSVFLSFGFLFSQPFGRYSSIYLIFCQSAFYHLVFLTVSHLYS